MRLLWLALGMLVLGGSAPAEAGRTRVVPWTPFDSSAAIKKSFKVHNVGERGDCHADASETLGHIAYRCSFGNFLADPCWRDGPNPSDYVVCVDTPWATSVYRVRVSRLLLRVGVTWGPILDSPWDLELSDGDRCRLLTGAHDTVPWGLVVDYRCESGISLLRNLRRGRVWKIGAARYDGNRYHRLPDERIRRAFQGSLPRAMRIQHDLATEAIAPARRVIRRSLGKTRRQLPLEFVSWVRLTLPDAAWARVGFEEAGTQEDGFYDAVLHRINGRWVDTQDLQPYCQKLPAEALQQLFYPDYCPG